MERHPQALWSLYQLTEFLLTQPLSTRAHFAIITACNPQGELLTPSQNRLLDRQLEADIDALGVPYRALVGTDKARQHMENSWAVFIDEHSSIQLALKYCQNAMYYVRENELTLVPCLMNFAPQSLGAFSARVELVPELPELAF